MLKKNDREIKVMSYALQRLEDECSRLEDECSRLQAENDALRAARECAVDAAVGLENEIAKLKEEIAKLNAETALLEHQRNEAWDAANSSHEAWEALRWRIWVLLNSTNVDAADVFESDIRYRLADEQATIPQDAERK